MGQRANLIESPFKNDYYLCPCSNVPTKHSWISLHPVEGEGPLVYRQFSYNKYFVSICDQCKNESLWMVAPNGKGHRLIYPKELLSPKPHPEMPEAIKSVYQEARLIAEDSPRAAIALLRLCVELQARDIVHGGAENNLYENINRMIDQGCSKRTIKAMTLCRLCGNDRLHQIREIQENENTDVYLLFNVVNWITEENYHRSKKIDEEFAKQPATKTKELNEKLNSRGRKRLTLSAPNQMAAQEIAP